MFDEKTKQELKSYVYMLLDPQDEKPFYIGKGKENNRVFDHIACALTDVDSSTLKFDKIRKISARGQVVKHIIIRHGLSDYEAFQIEAALIDTLNYCGFKLTNLQGGHNSIEKGLMTSEEVIRLYNAQPLDEIGDDCVLININKTYKRGNGLNPIYQATKETWFKIGNMLERKYVLSEYKGLIVEVFEVGQWYEKPRQKNKTLAIDDKGKKIQIKIDSIGYGFEGVVAPKEIRNIYIHKSIAHKKIRGQANPVRLKL